MGKAQELMSAALRMSEKEAVARARGQDFSGKHVKTYHVGQRVLYHGEGADITSRTKSTSLSHVAPRRFAAAQPLSRSPTTM